MFFLTAILVSLIALDHLLSGSDALEYLYISQFRESDVAVVSWIGYAIFVVLISLFWKMHRLQRSIRAESFAQLYFLDCLLAVAMMFTSSYSSFHLLCYVSLIALVTAVYWFRLFLESEYLGLLLWMAGLIAIFVWVGPQYGGPPMQKALLLYFVCVLNLHYYGSRGSLRMT